MAKKTATRKRVDDAQKDKARAEVKSLVAKGKSQNQACEVVADKLGTSKVTVYSWMKGPAKTSKKGKTAKKAQKKSTRKQSVPSSNGSIRESLITKINETLTDDRLLEIVLEECIS